MTLVEAIHSTFRRLHSSKRTEEAYLYWICAFLRMHGRQRQRPPVAHEPLALHADARAEGVELPVDLVERRPHVVAGVDRLAEAHREAVDRPRQEHSIPVPHVTEA